MVENSKVMTVMNVEQIRNLGQKLMKNIIYTVKILKEQ